MSAERPWVCGAVCAVALGEAALIHLGRTYGSSNQERCTGRCGSVVKRARLLGRRDAHVRRRSRHRGGGVRPRERTTRAAAATRADCVRLPVVVVGRRRAVFEAVDPDRWSRVVGHNPVRLLAGAHASTLERAAGDQSLVERIGNLTAELDADRDRPLARRSRRQSSTRSRSAAPSSACTARCPSIPAGSACWPATS